MTANSPNPAVVLRAGLVLAVRRPPDGLLALPTLPELDEIAPVSTRRISTAGVDFDVIPASTGMPRGPDWRFVPLPLLQSDLPGDLADALGEAVLASAAA